MGLEQRRNRRPLDGVQQQGKRKRRAIRDPNGDERRRFGRSAALSREIDTTKVYNLSIFRGFVGRWFDWPLYPVIEFLDHHLKNLTGHAAHNSSRRLQRLAEQLSG